MENCRTQSKDRVRHEKEEYHQLHPMCLCSWEANLCSWQKSPLVFGKKISQYFQTACIDNDKSKDNMEGSK